MSNTYIFQRYKSLSLVPAPAFWSNHRFDATSLPGNENDYFLQMLFKIGSSFDDLWALNTGEAPDALHFYLFEEHFEFKSSRLSNAYSDEFLIGTNAGDTIHAGGGSNIVIGGAGNDVLDVRWSSLPDKDGLNFAEWREHKRGATDWLWGGEGDDRLEGSFGTDIQHGGSGNDQLRGQDGDDRLYGESGDDFLRGDNGHDLLSGGDGRDHLVGNRGNDTLIGGNGADRLEGGNGADRIEGGVARDIIYGGYGDDAIYAGDGDDWIDAGHGADLIYLGAGDDFVAAIEQFGRGDDTIFGEAGNDWIHGGRQDDRIDGGSGNDRINGGAGEDLLIGGSGADIFEFRSNYGYDTIQDFSAEDRLQFSIGINGLGITGAGDLTERLIDLGTGAYLDLGADNGIFFLDISAEELQPIFEEQFAFFT